MSNNLDYSRLGTVLRNVLQKEGRAFLGEFETLEERLSREIGDDAIIAQLMLFLKAGNTLKYLPQVDSGIGMIDINNILSCTEVASGLSRSTVKKLLSTVLYGLSLPDHLTTVEIPTDDGSVDTKDVVILSQQECKSDASFYETITDLIGRRDIEEFTKTSILGVSMLDLLERKAKDGDAEALYLKGLCYFSGFSVEENQEEAVRYFKMAAHNGSIKAGAALGDYYFMCDTPDYTKAFKYYTMLGAIANSHLRQQRIKIIVEEGRLNKKLLVANAILLAALLVFDVLLITGFFSAYGTAHMVWGIISGVLSCLVYGFSVLTYINERYNSLKWSTAMLFVLNMLGVLFALL